MFKEPNVFDKLKEDGFSDRVKGIGLSYHGIGACPHCSFVEVVKDHQSRSKDRFYAGNGAGLSMSWRSTNLAVEWASRCFRREKGKLDKVVSEVNGLHPKVVKFQNSSKLEKGKGLCVSKTQRKGLPLYYQNAKLIIGKIKGKFSKVAKIEELSSSTSESDSCGFFWKKGECSSKIRIASQLKGDLLSNGLEGNNMGLFSIQVGAQVCSHERSLECGSVVHKQITGLVVDLMNRQDINTQLS
ncbi:hypothetical protein Q3G72_026405 [Acer saccharum]|nr:hypothetical protein Q3G72_026405 [Acer saccharum]